MKDGPAPFACSIEFDFGGTRWQALPQRVAFWLARRWLVVADAHFGKAAVFRARGVPVPRGTTQAIGCWQWPANG